MSNILMFYGLEDPPVVMSRNYFSAFAERYGCDIRTKPAREIEEADLAWCDVGIGVRCQSALEACVAELLKKTGRKFFLSMDDNFLAIPDHKLRRPQEDRATRKCLRLADALLVVNDELGKSLCEASGCPKYVRGDTSAEEVGVYPPAAQDGKTIRIAYYCNDGSTGEIDKLICPILPKLYARYGETLQWTVYSAQPAFQYYTPEHYERMPLEDFRRSLREGRYTFGIAPLTDNEFNRGKYINKFMEYTAAGIPCLYSNVPPYRGFIKDGVNGLLCGNTEEEWLQGIERMMDAELRETIIQNAQRQLKNEFSQEHLMECTARDLPELISHRAPGLTRFPSLRPARYRALAESFARPFSRALGRLKAEGLWSVLNYTWENYIRGRKQ